MYIMWHTCHVGNHVYTTGVRSGPAPFKASGPPPKAPKPGSKPAPAAPTAKPPVFELQEKKWMVVSTDELIVHLFTCFIRLLFVYLLIRRAFGIKTFTLL